MVKSFEYKGVTYKHGDKVIGTIEGVTAIGSLYINGSSCYFCQDVKDGASSPNKLGYSFSWSFSVVDSDNLGSGVIIFGKGGTTEYKKYKDMVSRFKVQLDSITSIVNYKSSCVKVSRNGYPSCCGSTVLHNYSLDDFPEEILDDPIYTRFIRERLFFTTNATIQILGRDKNVLDFFVKLGFKVVDTYRNSNSGNVIHLLTYSNNDGK